jgi:hypothetical protein
VGKRKGAIMQYIKKRLGKLIHGSGWKASVFEFSIYILLGWQIVANLQGVFNYHFPPLPTPIRLGLAQFFIFIVVLVLLPARPEVPAIAVPVLWVGAFCVALIVVLIFPRKSNSKRMIYGK